VLYDRHFRELLLQLRNQCGSCGLDKGPLEELVGRYLPKLGELGVNVSSEAFCVDLVLLVRDS